MNYDIFDVEKNYSLKFKSIRENFRSDGLFITLNHSIDNQLHSSKESQLKKNQHSADENIELENLELFRDIKDYASAFFRWIEVQLEEFELQLNTSVKTKTKLSTNINPIESKNFPKVKSNLNNYSNETLSENPVLMNAESLVGQTFCGIPIKSVQSKQKKRMTPSLIIPMNEQSIKPPTQNNTKDNSQILLKGNINTVEDSVVSMKEVIKQQKDVILDKNDSNLSKPSTSSSKLKSKHHINNSIATSSLLQSKNHIDTSITTSSNDETIESILADDIELVDRLIHVYNTLIKQKILTSNSLLQIINKISTFVGTSFSSSTIYLNTVYPVLTSINSLNYFVQKLLNSNFNLISSFGPFITFEMTKIYFLKVNHPSLIKDLMDSLDDDINFNGNHQVDFKLSESFIKPFRDDLDNRFEYKTSLGK